MSVKSHCFRVSQLPAKPKVKPKLKLAVRIETIMNNSEKTEHMCPPVVILHFFLPSHCISPCTFFHYMFVPGPAYARFPTFCILFVSSGVGCFGP